MRGVTLPVFVCVFTITMWWGPSVALADGTAIWNGVLEKSCPFEFNPNGAQSFENLVLANEGGYSTWSGYAHRDNVSPGYQSGNGYPSDRMSLLASWVGDKFDPRIMQESLFDYESISAWPTNPWSTNIACGAMLAWNPTSFVFTWTIELALESIPSFEASRYVVDQPDYQWECGEYLGPVRFPRVAFRKRYPCFHMPRAIRVIKL